MKRRDMVGAAAATAAFTILPRHVLGGAGYIAPSEKLNLALIGAGGRGRQVLKGMLAEPDVRVVAVADPADSFSLKNFYYKDIGGRTPTKTDIEKHYRASDATFQCAAYEDFQEMLSQENDLDGVICGTPDHLHAFVSLSSLRAGKHVYCEKPLTHNLWESQLVAETAKQVGLATQMGNQGHSSDGIRQTCEWLWAGAIGNVTEVKAWVSGHRWNPTLTGRPDNLGSAEPEGLNWDLWLGPRAERPFSDAYFPVAWRDFWAFGNSNIGDFACHDLDAACWALELTAPETIDFQPAGPCNAEIGPHGCIGYYHFPATEKRGPVDVTWYDGGLKPDLQSVWPKNTPIPGRGILFVGDEGNLFCGGAGGEPQLLDAKRDRSFKRPEPTLRRVENHARDWLDACKGGPPAGSNFEYGSRLTDLALLGALSLRTGKAIRWDSQSRSAIGNEAAASIVKESYRPDWRLER